MIKKAFTTIELIFIVILIGVMSAVVTSYFRDDKLALATYQVLEHIRYTQHLALSDHKFDPKDTKFKTTSGYAASREGMYYRGWWQIRFVKQMNGIPEVVGYSVYADIDRQGNIDLVNLKNPAINPSDGFMMTTVLKKPFSDPESEDNNVSREMNMLLTYSITDISFSTNCQAAGFTMVQNSVGAIIFDEKGRPYYGIANNAQKNPYQYILTTNCDITLTHASGRQSVIRVHPETGYAEITRLD
jgi:hypothetical protein